MWRCALLTHLVVQQLLDGKVCLKRRLRANEFQRAHKREKRK
jgi:hypothetical protein